MISIIRVAKKFIKSHIPGIRILLYHRVGIVNNDPQLLCVTPDHFKEHLEVLYKNFKVVDLEEAVLNGNNLGDAGKVIVITFDDGYADNLYQAKPILENYGMPATVFVVSGQTGEQQEFWWDDLARIFFIQPVLPTKLQIRVRSQNYLWNIENSALSNLSDLQWNVLNSKNLNSRQKAYIDVARIIKTCSHPERNAIIDSIYQWAGLDALGRQDFRVMNQNELAALIDGGLIKIGSHTRTHVTLSAVDEETQFNEILESKKSLEEMLNKRISLFSYPFGGKKDYNATTIKILKRLDFRLACSNFPDRVYRTTNRFQLPRILVRDWDGNTFEKFLSGW